ncbi:MAG TPA: type II secretion system protein GspG [Fimbriimonadaceae bacterium]|nr:type II secretion system protein GspG [Fimbriimonadaceae bacterium]
MTAETTVSHVPRELGRLGKLLLAITVVLTAAFGVCAGIAIRAKTTEDEKRKQTKLLMTRFLEEVRHRPGNSVFSPPPRPLADSDPTGQKAIAACFNDFAHRNSYMPTTDVDARSEDLWKAFQGALRQGNARDGWGHPYLYRSPGVLHKEGWDLISCGPNGIDEEGKGDDLIVGEDTPLVVSDAQREEEQDLRSRGMRRIETTVSKVAQTKVWLTKLLAKASESGATSALPSGNGQSTDDPYGQRAFRESFRWRDSMTLRDAWDRPIYYRCPGPIHKKGFDLISCGPNGVYEEGQGDDIVVGEDLPGGIAAISSESGSGTTETR